MKIKILGIFAVLICAGVLLAGCTGSSGTPASPGGAGTAPSTQDNLQTSPTDAVPENNQVSVIVQEKVYDGKIPVVFDGGKGLYMVKSIQVTLYRADGQVKTYSLGIKKGDTVDLEGTKQTDRVVVHVTEMNGQTYKVTDVTSSYRTRQ